MSRSARSELNTILFAGREEERYNYPKNAVLGTTAALTLPIVGQTAAGLGALALANKHFMGTAPVEGLKGDAVAMRYLRREAHREGAKIHESKHPMVPAAAWDHKASGRMFEQSGRAQVEAMTGSKDDRGVIMSKGVRASMKPGLLAHEVGHLKGHRALLHPLTRVGAIYGGMGTAGVAAITDNEDVAKKSAIIGGLASIPMMASELDASRRGAGLLHKAGVKGMRRLSPFMGIPSYAAIAAMAPAAYLIKKGLGGYREKQPTQQLSARAELNLILFGEDPRPRNALGMFSGGGEGGPNPQSMQITYQPQVVQQGAQQASMAGVPEVQQGQQPMPPQPPQQDPQQKPKKIVKRQ